LGTITSSTGKQNFWMSRGTYEPRWKLGEYMPTTDGTGFGHRTRSAGVEGTASTALRELSVESNVPPLRTSAGVRCSSVAMNAFSHNDEALGQHSSTTTTPSII
jgi:hypothetical protein